MDHEKSNRLALLGSRMVGSAPFDLGPLLIQTERGYPQNPKILRMIICHASSMF